LHRIFKIHYFLTILIFIVIMNTKKLQALLTEQTAAAIQTAASEKTTKKSLTKKATDNKKEVIKTKTTEEKPKSKKKEVIKETAKQQDLSIKEKVVSTREVKWLYPDDVTDTLTRKSWRQARRNELHRLENNMAKIQDKNSKEWKKLNAEYQEKCKKYLKPGQTA